MSDSYLGLDQQYNIPMEIIERTKQAEQDEMKDEQWM